VQGFEIGTLSKALGNKPYLLDEDTFKIKKEVIPRLAQYIEYNPS